MPRNHLPAPVAPQKRPGVPIIRNFDFTVCVLRASNQLKRDNRRIAKIVNDHMLGGVGFLYVSVAAAGFGAFRLRMMSAFVCTMLFDPV